MNSNNNYLIICQNCDINIATKSCNDCNEIYCNDCDAIIHNPIIKKSKNHKRKDIINNVQETFTFKSQNLSSFPDQIF